MKVEQPPKIQFKCRNCGAVCSGDAGEFVEQHTMPPTWLAKCAWCNLLHAYSPKELIAKAVGSMSGGDVAEYLTKRLM